MKYKNKEKKSKKKYICKLNINKQKISIKLIAKYLTISLLSIFYLNIKENKNQIKLFQPNYLSEKGKELFINENFVYDKEKELSYYNNYINDCYQLKNYNRKKVKNKIPFISICLPAYNMEKYIESTILSIINQSFQDLEIIILNDNSKDNTENIVNRLILNDKRIKIINHSKNLGVYASRVDGFLNSKGKYTILMDPDDMLFNPDLLSNLHNLISKFNLDIIEYKMYIYNEKKKYLYIDQNRIHNHHFNNKIIMQPELSNLHFYKVGTKIYSEVICTSLRNFIIRRDILLKTFKYIGQDYYKEFIITAEDKLINIINFEYANNYSNIDFPGYMYNIREGSMTHLKTKNHSILFKYNYLLYIRKLYKFIKDFNKDINFLYYDLKRINFLLLELKLLESSKKVEVNNFYQELLENINIQADFRNYLIKSLNKN